MQSRKIDKELHTYQDSDQRTQKTPRAELIYESFRHGGPLALTGVFYATLDAHRNLRNLETLEFFL